MQVCLNLAIPAQAVAFKVNGNLLRVNLPQPALPAIILTKTVSNSQDGPFSEVAILSGDRHEGAVYFKFRVHNTGLGTSKDNVLCDPAVDGLVPVDSVAQQLASQSCMKIADIAPQGETTVTAQYRAATAGFTSTMRLDNSATVANSSGQRAEAHATVVYVPPAPPQKVVTVTKVEQASCAPSCFGLVGTSAPYAVPQGETLKLFVHADQQASSANAKLVGATITLNDDFGKHQKNWKVNQTVPIDKSVTQPVNGAEVHYLESIKLLPGNYTVLVTFEVGGARTTCPMKIWVPKKGMSKWVPVLTFVIGVGVGIFIGYEIFGAGAAAASNKATGQCARWCAATAAVGRFP